MKKSNLEGAAKVFTFAQYLVVANITRQLIAQALDQSRSFDYPWSVPQKEMCTTREFVMPSKLEITTKA